jgi:dTDP-4-dehydrorhamnose reductase
LNMSAILVTGASGQVGRELCARAATLGVPLHAADRRELDITDRAKVEAAISRISPFLVVNAAAYTKVDRAEVEVDEAFRTNAVGAGIVAGACADAQVPLVHLSTDYVFDGQKPTAYTEEDPVAPLSAYGRSKMEGESAVRRMLAQHVILRTSWVYGIYGSNFLKTVMRLAREQNELRMVADQRGCPTGTADIAEAILFIARRIATQEAVWGTYHFAGRGVTTWHGFATEIVAAQAPITGYRPKLVAIPASEHPAPTKRPANSVLDCSRFEKTFGVRAENWRARTRSVVAALLTRK